MKSESTYIHGTHTEEQKRLSLLNEITNNAFIDFLSIYHNDSILEVGSGLGILANEIAARFPDTAVTGIEIAAEQIEKARNNFGSTENLKFIQGNALSLDIEDSSCDLVYCRYVLEHVSDPQTVLKEILRVLKDGGRFFIQENNVLMNSFYPDCPDYNFVLKKSIDLQSKLGGDAEIGKKLFYLLKQAGFSSIELSICPEVHYYNSPAFDPWIVNSIEILRSEKDMLMKMENVIEDEIDSAINELNELRQNPYASSYFYWNRASVVKQGNDSRL
ncbi:MAG: class I SAM-dependent methyltransferase [Spirochaetes bacterium]|nr:class I SAM-dependent methyltransferase [Spirochaetota bacterium]